MSQKQFEIITFPLVEQLRAEGILPPLAESRLYPDGSVRVVGHALGDIIRQKTHREGVGYGVCHFRPIAPFGERLYTITWPGWYELLLSRFDEAGIIFMPNFNKPTEAESDLSHVRVRVELHRKFTPQIAESLARTISDWFRNIGAAGVFDESGVSSISPRLLWLKQNACFELDATSSGQETLNTLYLAILNWGMTGRRPLYQIDLAMEGYEKVLTSEASVPLV